MPLRTEVPLTRVLKSKKSLDDEFNYLRVGAGSLFSCPPQNDAYAQLTTFSCLHFKTCEVSLKS